MFENVPIISSHNINVTGYTFYFMHWYFSDTVEY